MAFRLNLRFLCCLNLLPQYFLSRYQKLLENEASLLANVEARGTGLDEERDTDEYKKLRNLLMQLRKCCNHP
jgi:hypothetical protein